MLSSRFIAWQMPPNQTIATRVNSEGRAPLGSAPARANTRNAPIASDATSLASGESCSRSSNTPTTNIARAASGTGIQSPGAPTRSGRAISAQKPAIVAAAMAIPPIVGVGAVCHRSGRGGTTAPLAEAKRRTSAPPATLHAAAITNTTARNISTIRQPLAALASSGVRSDACSTKGCRLRIPSQIVSSPADAPGRSCCRRSSLSR